MRGRILTISILAAALGACSPQAFQVGQVQTEPAPVGFFSVPAKVDILIAQDNTASMFEAMDGVSAQLATLFTELDNRGWNYRVVTTPLTHNESTGVLRDIQEIAPAAYDCNWEMVNGWLPLFPGADCANIPETEAVTPALFRTPFNYSGFITSSDIDVFVNGRENGFKTIRKALLEKAPAADFLRPDAMTVVLAISNGNDHSDVNMCQTAGNNSVWVPCGEPGTQPGDGEDNRAETFNQYLADFRSLVTDELTTDIKFYSLVSTSNSAQENCVGPFDRALPGYRYAQMAYALGGAAFDICTQSISSALDAMSSHLQAQFFEFVTRYAVLGYEPDETQIQVSINGIPVPMDPMNGWTYLGGPITVPTIEFPVEMDLQTGWVIEFNGSAKPRGDDVVEVIAPPSTGTPST